MQGGDTSGWPNRYDAELSELEVITKKYQNLQREWDSQQEHLGRLQGEVFKLRNQLQMQSSFCASLGSIMGNLIWKASRLQPVVELFLTTNKLTDFFCIVSGTLLSFTATYGREMPDITCNETQFILSMCGIITNLAAVPDGRQFLATDLNGKELIDQILVVLPKIPHPSGDPLKSINENGLVLMQENKTLLASLSKIIVDNRSPELKILALRLMESTTFDIPNALILMRIQQCISIPKLESLTDAGDAEIRQYATNILENLKKAEIALFGQPNELSQAGSTKQGQDIR